LFANLKSVLRFKMKGDRYQINLLPYKEVLKLCKKYFKKKERPKRGKPKIYDDYFIIFIAVIMQMYEYSFREVVVILERALKRKLPSISTLHYRLKKLDDKVLEEALLKISQEIIKKN